VARALKTLGEKPLVTGWVGGYAGGFIEERLQSEGIDTAFVQTRFESRTCLSILDPSQGYLTEIYEKGEPVPARDQEIFIETYQAQLARCDLVVLAGSLPPGVPADFYATLSNLARQAGVRVLLDSNGPPLKFGLERGKPFLIKPNRYEFQELSELDPASLDAVARAAAQLASEYQTWVVISLGKEGLVAAHQGSIWRAHPPELPVTSAVGSGDSLLAGLAYGLTHQYSDEEILRLGVSAGTANALSAGAGRFRIQEVKNIYDQIEIQMN
jgi:1-phosphofructokinase family hexose kinase